MLAIDLIRKSLLSLEVIGAGDPITGDDQTDCFNALNDMLDAWAAKRLTIPSVTRNAYAVDAVHGTPANPYTIGPGGILNQTRPLWVQNAELLQTNTNPPIEFPLHIMTEEEYAVTSAKTLASALASDLFYDRAFPQTGANQGLGNIFLYPVPNGALPLNLVLYTAIPLTQFADVNTTQYSFPPGYAEALRYQLAKRLISEYGVPPEVAQTVLGLAAETFGVIQQTNVRMPLLRCDSAIVPRGGAYNWRTGGYGRRG